MPAGHPINESLLTFYKLRTSHLKGLIDWVEQGNSVQSHDDVPKRIQEQLVAEEQQRLEWQPNAPANAATPFPPINITKAMTTASSTCGDGPRAENQGTFFSPYYLQAPPGEYPAETPLTRRA
jgi:hypothetical protein